MTELTVDHIVATTLIILVIGACLVASLLLVPGKKAAARDTFEALWSMLLVTVTTLAVFWGGTYAIVFFMILLAFRTGLEAGHVLLGKKFAIRIGLGSALIAAVTASLPILALMFAGAWMLLLARRIMVPAATGEPVSKLVELFLYPILPIAILTTAALNAELRPIVLILYVIVELFDSMAYASGKFLGKTPAFPVLSPRKTVEGLAGGAVSILIIATGTAWVVGLSVPQAALLTVIACVFGVAGDLAGSRLKRAGGVKDFPVVLRKQGGALDIWDSWIAAGAAVSVLFAIWELL